MANDRELPTTASVGNQGDGGCCAAACCLFRQLSKLGPPAVLLYRERGVGATRECDLVLRQRDPL